MCHTFVWKLFNKCGILSPMILFTGGIHRYFILNIDIFVALLEANSSLLLHNSQKENFFSDIPGSACV